MGRGGKSFWDCFSFISRKEAILNRQNAEVGLERSRWITSDTNVIYFYHQRYISADGTRGYSGLYRNERRRHQKKRRADIEYDIHYCSVMSMSESRRKSTSNPLKHKGLEVCMFIQMYVFWAKIRFSRWNLRQKVQNKNPENPYQSRLPGSGGISRARTYDLHDVNVAL